MTLNLAMNLDMGTGKPNGRGGGKSFHEWGTVNFGIYS